jgi:hypothetical protein
MTLDVSKLTQRLVEGRRGVKHPAHAENAVDVSRLTGWLKADAP